MAQTVSAKTLLPRLDGRALDLVKIMAAAFMLVDHVNDIFFDTSKLGMLLIGRATYPLFCYALAMAFLKIGPEKSLDYAFKKYVPRLLPLALVSQAVVFFTHDAGMLNVIFTLALAAIVAGLSARLKDWQLVLLCAAAVILNEPFTVLLLEFRALPEFGLAGIFLPAGIMMYMQGRKGGLACMLALIALLNLGNASDIGGGLLATSSILYITAVWFCSTVLPWWVIQKSQNLPQEGRLLHKYALHVFYPGHLLLLWGCYKLTSVLNP